MAEQHFIMFTNILRTSAFPRMLESSGFFL